ncbi:VWA domain-containing protein [Catellatospora sp. IY07-71]|uniref:vWA domain-containing protein n=1 Tax=Catellatospora sp. IY07-71 TaxID=2728827 RepID=UPI001BB3E0BE|nr:substrate-binding domain-containing protein [Catellatospora sp. IY07-71]BCJ74631.1 VWA domain-containing protein [Catellatospora sp. IY07-71]
MSSPADPGGGPARRDGPDREMVSFVAVSLLSLVTVLAQGVPDTFLQWFGAVVGALAGGVAAQSAVVARLLDRGFDVIRVMRTVRWERFRWVLTMLARTVLGLLVALALVLALPRAVAWVKLRLDGCPPPVALRLVTTPEQLPTARDLADAFAASTADGNQGCLATGVFVYAADPVLTAEAVRLGWAAEHLLALGPRPELWLPGSTYFTAGLAGLPVATEVRPVAATPVVLALPEGADVGAGPRTRTWSQLLQSSRRYDWSVARPDPAVSFTGELATHALYAGLDGLTPAELERLLASGLDRGGYPLGDELSLLCRHASSAGGAVTSLIVTEQQLLRYQRDRELGDACPPGGRRPALRAVYPSDTLGLDFPAVRIGWADASAEQDAQARAFLSWLDTPAGRAALAAGGLRTPQPGGDLPAVEFVSTPPSGSSLATTMDAYDRARRPGRVLLALDTSGSMAAPVADGGRSRYDVAAAGIANTLRLRGPADEFGLWAFPHVGGARQLFPIEPRQLTEAQVEDALRRIRPQGPTPLYRTIADAVPAVRTDTDAVQALVVLTDGEDTGSGLSRRQLVDRVRGQGVRVFVVAVGEASCGGALAEVAGATGGTCRQASFDDLEGTVSDIFSLLWKGA